MSYLLSLTSSVQANSVARSLSTLVNYNLSALEVDQVATISVKLNAGVEQTVVVPGIVKLYLICAQSLLPIDLALVGAAGERSYSQLGSNLIMRVFNNGTIFDQIALRSELSTVVELVVGGRSSVVP